MSEELMFGPYRIGPLLGRGGMGEVHTALDSRTGREVALKLMPATLASDPSFAARFRRESELAARLTNPHIIPIHEYGEIDGTLYIDMRLVRGTDLAALVRTGPLPPGRAVEVVTQVADALDAAHGAGLVHRDVKPSNVLIDEHGVCFLIDFGIARSVAGAGDTALTSTGLAVGTVAYLAPERITAAPADHRADVYALACVLYELLTGAAPFGTGDAMAVMYAHVHRAPPLPSAAGAPAALDHVVAQGMAKDPAFRHPTAGALAAAARAALWPATAAVPLTRPVPRRRVLIGVGAAVALAAAGGTAAVIWGAERGSATPQAGDPRPTAGGTTTPPGGGAAAYPIATGVEVPGSPTFAAMSTTGNVLLGVKEDQPGLGFKDVTTGEYAGFDIEIARMVAAGLGFGPEQLTYVPLTAAVREDQITQGAVSYYVGTYTINDRRKQAVSFAGPYFVAGQSLLVRAAETAITGADNTLFGRRVCSVTGSTPAANIRSKVLTQPENIVEFPAYSLCVDALLNGSVDAVTTDDAILAGYAAQQPDELKLVGTPITTEPYGIGLKRDDTALRTKINDLLQAAIDDGTWQRIYDATLGKSGYQRSPPPLERY